jgi:ATP-binding protein involved in chromosome partitioning
MIDPRLDIIGRRIAPVRRILAFSSAKGGVGKSVCAALCSLALADSGHRTGLLDLDFQGASAHLLLGVNPGFPEEDGGLKPLRVKKTLDFMSFAAFSGERPVPLRGAEVSEAMLELLAVTIWRPLDFLLVDMPPGLGDEILDALRFLRRPEFLVVATPSQVALRVVERLLAMLSELKVPVAGVIENMAAPGVGPAARTPPDPEPRPLSAALLAERYGVELLGSVPFEKRIDEILAGEEPLDSAPGRSIRRIAGKLSR